MHIHVSIYTHHIHVSLYTYKYTLAQALLPRYRWKSYMSYILAPINCDTKSFSAICADIAYICHFNDTADILDFPTSYYDGMLLSSDIYGVHSLPKLHSPTYYSIMRY